MDRRKNIIKMFGEPDGPKKVLDQFGRKIYNEYSQIFLDILQAELPKKPSPPIRVIRGDQIAAIQPPGQWNKKLCLS